MSRRFFIALIIVIIITGCGYVIEPLFYLGVILAFALSALLIYDYFTLYGNGKMKATRLLDDKWSNGDYNVVKINITSSYAQPMTAEVFDELPHIFQIRDFTKTVNLQPNVKETIEYEVLPKERGEYQFGHVIVMARTRIGLAERRFQCAEEQSVKVYPSFFSLEKYELTTIRSPHHENGTKRLRRIGNATEFAQIKEYVTGDDYRKINWKASARRHQLMVNVYEDEKAQYVYNIIDKGRVMQQSFLKITLLDHSINAALALSHIATKKDDNIGLLTFDNKIGAFLPSTHSKNQMNNILEKLYNIHTEFLETDFAELSNFINKKITKRSLLILYTNFFSMDALKRQLPYLKTINKRHRLLVVFFEDNEQNEYMKTKPQNAEEYYQHVIAEKYAFDKQFMVTMLNQQGILALLTEPKNLNVSVINKYLDIKARNLF